MPDETIVKLIKREMGGWDGTSKQRRIRSKSDYNQIKRTEWMWQWAQEMVEWGKAVRRDILVLEHHIAAIKSSSPASLFYGDPGDPPPEPPEPTS